MCRRQELGGVGRGGRDSAAAASFSGPPWRPRNASINRAGSSRSPAERRTSVASLTAASRSCCASAATARLRTANGCSAAVAARVVFFENSGPSDVGTPAPPRGERSRNRLRPPGRAASRLRSSPSTARQPDRRQLELRILGLGRSQERRDPSRWSAGWSFRVVAAVARPSSIWTLTAGANLSDVRT